MRAPLFASAVLVAAVLAGAPRAQRLAGSRPNILFVFSDDHACHAIGAYGSRVNRTPNLDRIASGGVLFRRNFCGNALCGPSRATILTGQHSHANGFCRNGNVFDGSQTTFPKLLQQSRLPDRDRRQVASGVGAHRLRPLDRAAGPGAVLQS
jgi:hypothetical protein